MKYIYPPRHDIATLRRHGRKNMIYFSVSLLAGCAEPVAACHLWIYPSAFTAFINDAQKKGLLLSHGRVTWKR